ncbi:MAG: hypothetical protein V3V33_16595 [Candidatus Lokiarchaeia archaeon]
MGITENMEILKPLNEDDPDSSTICIAVLDQDNKEDMVNHILDMMTKNPQWKKEYTALLNILTEESKIYVRKREEDDNKRDKGST